MTIYDVDPEWEQSLRGSPAKSIAVWLAVLFFVLDLGGIVQLAIRVRHIAELSRTVTPLLILVLFLVLLAVRHFAESYGRTRRAISEIADPAFQSLVVRNSHDTFRVYCFTAGGLYAVMAMFLVLLSH